MILFRLACADGHSFETWFRDNASYDEQVRRRLVTCPSCGSSDVSKTVMAPSVVGRAVVSGDAGSAHDDRTTSVREAIRDLRERAMRSEDVGWSFAETARRMHDGDEAKRPVRGNVSRADVESLLDDGIHVMPIPKDPDDLN